MSATGTDTLVYRLITEVLNQGRVAVDDDLFVPDYRDHHPRPGQGLGREGYHQGIIQLRTGFPDLHITRDDLIAAGDKVVLRLTAQGLHQGEFAGIPPTGRPITVMGTPDAEVPGEPLGYWLGRGRDWSTVATERPPSSTVPPLLAAVLAAAGRWS